ncbi:hypothetical protein NMG60_11012825 [Bertholletia excelsa]
MATSTTIKLSALFLLISLSPVISLKAASYRGLETMKKKIDSNLLLLELGIDFSKMKQNRRKMINTDRVAPGGPDPQHHEAPPSMS